jgi:hypothetical protein
VEDFVERYEFRRAAQIWTVPRSICHQKHMDHIACGSDKPQLRRTHHKHNTLEQTLEMLYMIGLMCDKLKCPSTVTGLKEWRPQRITCSMQELFLRKQRSTEDSRLLAHDAVSTDTRRLQSSSAPL